jgi:hypothetical protein
VPAQNPANRPDASGSIDFIRIRAEYGDREDFDEICEKDHPLRKFVELSNAEQWPAVLDVSLGWLATCPVDIHARLVAAVALSKMGRGSESEEHRFWYWGLVGSVLASGDGRTAETAFVVISVPEEYAILSALGLRGTRQTLREGGIDEIVVEGRRGAASVFFNPAAHWRRLHREARPDGAGPRAASPGG